MHANRYVKNSMVSREERNQKYHDRIYVRNSMKNTTSFFDGKRILKILFERQRTTSYHFVQTRTFSKTFVRTATF